MSQSAKKRLQEFKVESAGPHDVATMVIEYLHHTADTVHEQTLTVFLFLARWRAAIEREAAPLQAAKAKRIGVQLKRLLDDALAAIDDLGEASAGINRNDVDEVRRDPTQS
jgi:hypothetical protein